MVVFGLVRGETAFSVSRLERSPDLLSLLKALREEHEDVVLLESAEGPRPLAEYSFLAFDPRAVIEVGHDSVTRVYVEGQLVEELEGDPLEHLKALTKPVLPQQVTPRLAGGAIGFVSYDAAFVWNECEVSRRDSGFPLMRFGIFEKVVVVDHVTGTAYLCNLGDSGRVDGLERALREAANSDGLELGDPGCEVVGHGSDRDRFLRAVEEAKDHIARGDVFQVVISRRVELRVTGDLLGFYAALRRINPSPYMYLLRLGDVELAGSSPEMLVRVEGRRVTTFPIAGTRRRERDPVAEEISDAQLLSDEKELAEHVMLVDLARNDLGMVSVPGSVNVAELMRLVKYSHVKHLVSRVEGTLREGLGPLDAFVSVFPAGTVTGAPKLRAMEIIDELEPDPRGPYAGAVGYISFNGCADFAIAIRTLFRKGDIAFVQAGAGIVWDSDPEREYLETEAKLMALLEAAKGAMRG
ncbi:MAG: anthranilate synthase component I family protein [Nitrososphaerota archaeon]